MSGPLAMAAVTATLKDLLNDGLLNHDLASVGSFTVSSLPPDRITTGQTEPNQLNLFLYHVTPNLGWRNQGLPSRDAAGARVSAPPLALDLHYLLTAYGSQDLNAEVLLGYAMQLLHETPVLTRAQLRTVLGPPPVVDGSLGSNTPLPSLFGTLSAADLADQIELIKISPVFLSTEELAKMWTAMQARYRPTMSYMVSVILIQSNAAGRAALPVLKRGADDRGPIALAGPMPSLVSIRPSASDLLPAMRLGDDLVATGTGLDTPDGLTAVFANARAGLVRKIAPGVPRTQTSLAVALPSVATDPDAMHEWAIGLYSVSLRVARPDAPGWSTDGVPITLAPAITVSPSNAAVGDVVTLTCAPRLLAEQHSRTTVIFGKLPVVPSAITTPADATLPTRIEFVVPGVDPGAYLVRLCVDGIDSVPASLVGTPPTLEFDPKQKVTVA